MASMYGSIFLNEQPMQTTRNPLVTLVQSVTFTADKHRNQRRKDAEPLTKASSSK